MSVDEIGWGRVLILKKFRKSFYVFSKVWLSLVGRGFVHVCTRMRYECKRGATRGTIPSREKNEMRGGSFYNVRRGGEGSVSGRVRVREI